MKQLSLLCKPWNGINGVAALSASGVKNLELPDETEKIWLLVDSDKKPVGRKEGFAGQKACIDKAKKLEKRGVEVWLVTPCDSCFTDKPDKMDFNELRPGEVKARFEAAIRPEDVSEGEWQKADQEEAGLLYAVDIRDFLAMDLPPRKNLMSPWLPEQGLAMIHALRGKGKTWVALQLAYAVAAGSSFLRWTAHEPHGVIYLDGEMPATAIQERMFQIAGTVGKPTQAPFRIITPDLQPGKKPMPNIAMEAGQAEIDKLIDEKIKLIVIDNISCLCSDGEENSAESWSSIQAWALKWRAAGKSIIFIHHSGKSGKQRGTSRREDVLDTVINLRDAGIYDGSGGACFQVFYEKSRGFYGEDAEPFEAALVDGQWTMQSLESSTYSQVVKLAKDGLIQSEVARVLELNRSTISRHFKKAKENGELVSR